MRRRLLVLIALLVSATGNTQEMIEGFDDPALDARYRALIHTIRCMKCQNQSIAESPVDQAADLRRQVRELMVAGSSDNEIREYMAVRYGDFINYQPPLKPTTWLLWAGPLLLLLGGVVIFARVVRARMQQPLDEELE